MSSRSRSRTTFGFTLGNVYSSGLSKSFGSGLGYGAGAGYSFSSGYNPSYGSGYSNYLARSNGNYYATQCTPSAYKKSYQADNPTGKEYTNSVSRYSATVSSDNPVSAVHKSYTPSSSSKSAKYSRSRTDSELVSLADRIGSTQPSTSSNWRSKSIEANGVRDTRSMSREAYSFRDNREQSLTRDAYHNSVDSYREPSVGRDRFRDFSMTRDFTPSREFTPSRDFSRHGSLGPDTLPLPPPRMKKQGFHKSASNLPLYDSNSRFTNSAATSLNRSKSFHDLHDSYQNTPKTRPRHRTLTYGVSEIDLAQARSAVDLSSSRGSLTDLRGAVAWRGSNRDLPANQSRSSFDFNGTSGGSSLHGLDSLSKSTLDLGYISQPSSRRTSIVNVPTSSSQTSQDLKTRNNLKSQNGDIDYKKLWEESQAENARLRLDMNAIRSDLDSTRHQLEAAIQASAKNSVSDTEKREKKVLEKKLAEMEEELKQLQKLKSENEKLKSENRALTRVVSKLTAAATKSGPTQPSQGPQVRK